jgi:protein RecA
MDNNKIIKDINKSLGKNVICLGKDMKPKEQLPTGIKELDELIGDGLTIGNFTIVYGSAGTGKSTLALQTLAQAQKEGKRVCYIDLEHSLEIPRAVSLGVNFDEVLVINGAETAEEAMDAMIILAKEKAVDFIVVDSIQAMSPKGEQETKKGKVKSVSDDTMALLARKLSEFLKRVATPISNAQISVLLIGQVRTKGLGSFFIRDGLSGGNALEHWAYQILHTRRGQKADSPQESHIEYFLDPDGKMHKKTIKEAVGFDTVVKLEKTKSSKSKPEFTEIHIPFYYATGFQVPEEKEERIVLDGTDEEKEILTKMLQEKGIFEPTVQSHLESKTEKFQEEVKKGTEELKKDIAKPKKRRGRPKKNESK